MAALEKGDWGWVEGGEGCGGWGRVRRPLPAGRRRRGDSGAPEELW